MALALGRRNRRCAGRGEGAVPRLSDRDHPRHRRIGAARAVGKLRETLPGTGADVTQGVSVEVGEKQAAVDVGLVAYYGVAIHQLAESIRTNVIEAIEKMTGLEVTEVNVTVHDVHLDTDDPTTALDGQTPRVQ